MRSMPKSKHSPFLLMILDGWGIAPASSGNAISSAATPNMTRYMMQYPTFVLHASGPPVGLRFGEVGNSEVGHSNLGSGRVVYQSLPRISRAISDGSFFRNEILKAAMTRCKIDVFSSVIKKQKTRLPRLHLMGILSESGVHGHMEHLFALLVMAKELGVPEVFIHGFLDGRDSPYDSGIKLVEKLLHHCRSLNLGKIATLSGRYYAMDRDHHWERIKKSFDALVLGRSKAVYQEPLEAISASYRQQVYDEVFLPTVMVDAEKNPIATIQHDDSVIFFNYRSDRARELTAALVQPEFSHFARRKSLRKLHFVSMMEYEASLPTHVAFAQLPLKNTLGETIAALGLKQMRIAETEKYAHVSFFFNGLSETVFPGENHILIPSPRVASYDSIPEMSSKEIVSKTMRELLSDQYGFFVVNFANVDMVAHTGNFSATVRAVEVVDRCIGELSEAVMNRGGSVCITADHGNAEELINLHTGVLDKEHSNNPVPAIFIHNTLKEKIALPLQDPMRELPVLNPHGVLSDVAPTILHIMGHEKPPEMTGVSLLPPL